MSAWGLGFRVQVSGFWLEGLGVRIQGSGGQGLGLRVKILGFRIQGSGFGVGGLGFRAARTFSFSCCFFLPRIGTCLRVQG